MWSIVGNSECNITGFQQPVVQHTTATDDIIFAFAINSGTSRLKIKTTRQLLLSSGTQYYYVVCLQNVCAFREYCQVKCVLKNLCNNIFLVCLELI